MIHAHTHGQILTDTVLQIDKIEIYISFIQTQRYTHTLKEKSDSLSSEKIFRRFLK